MSKAIRTIQYLGSKATFTDLIKEKITNITNQNEIVCDLFAGTGVIAQTLAETNTVYANDIQEYSSLICKVLLSNYDKKNHILNYKELVESKEYKKNKDYLTNIFKDQLKKEAEFLNNADKENVKNLCLSNVFYDGSLIDKNNEFVNDFYGSTVKYFSTNYINRIKGAGFPYALFTLYYSEGYFSLKQCIEIDSLKYAIDRINIKNENNRNFLLVCLMHSVSEIVSTVGKNFAQPIKIVNSKGEIKSAAIKRCINDRKLGLEEPFTCMYNKLLEKFVVKDNNIIFCEDSLTLINSGALNNVKTFYLDPPYTNDHYSRFYHVLETLVKYDYPSLATKKVKGETKLMNGRYRTDRYQSNFSIPSKTEGEFRTLIEKIHENHSNVVLSYSELDKDKEMRERIMTKEKLTDILTSYYQNIEIINVNHRYKKLSSKDSNKEEKNDGELLFVCSYE